MSRVLRPFNIDGADSGSRHLIGHPRQVPACISAEYLVIRPNLLVVRLRCSSAPRRATHIIHGRESAHPRICWNTSVGEGIGACPMLLLPSTSQCRVSHKALFPSRRRYHDQGKVRQVQHRSTKTRICESRNHCVDDQARQQE